MASLLLQACASTLILLLLSPLPTTFAGIILDIEGNPVRNAGDYFILPHELGTGGLTLTQHDYDSLGQCPLYIKQELYSNGYPIKISSIVRTLFLTTSYPIEFSFDIIKSTCPAPLRWWVTPANSNDQSFVVVGVESDQFKSTYLFNIVEANEYTQEGNKYVYNIQFCHVLLQSRIMAMGALFSSGEEKECNYVGFHKNGLLGNTKEPYPFVFKKATREFAA